MHINELTPEKTECCSVGVGTHVFVANSPRRWSCHTQPQHTMVKSQKKKPSGFSQWRHSCDYRVTNAIAILNSMGSCRFP